MTLTKISIYFFLFFLTFICNAQTPDELLAEALIFGDFKGAKKALKKGADPNGLAEEGNKAMLALAIEADIENDYMAELDYLYNEEITEMPVVPEGAIPFTKLLLDNGADPNDYSTKSYQNNEWITIGSIDIALASERLDIAKYLIENAGFNLKNPNRAPIIFSALKSNSHESIPYLVSKGADINALNSRGSSPLHVVIEMASEYKVRLLLENGADVNQPNLIGWSPLMNAINKGNPHILSEFDGYAVDFDYKDGNGHDVFWHVQDKNSYAIASAVVDISKSYFAQKRNMIIQSSHSADITSLTFSPNGSLFATAGRDEKIKIWDTQTGREIRTLKGHDIDIWQIKFNEAGTRLLSGGRDLLKGLEELCLWDVNSGIRLVKHDNIDGRYPVLFMPENKGQVFSTGKGAIYDLSDGRPVKIVQQMKAGDFSRDKKRFAGVVEEPHSSNKYMIEKIKIWNAGLDSIISVFEDEPSRTTDLKFSPDGKYIAGIIYKNVGIWSVATGKVEHKLQHNGYINSIDFSNDGKSMMIACDNGEVYFWNTTDWSLRKVIRASEDDVNAAIGPDDQYFITGGLDMKVRFWDFTSDEPLFSIFSNAGYSSFAHFHPTENLVFSGGTGLYFGSENDPSKNPVKVWDLTRGNLAGYWETDGGTTQLTFSPDGQSLFTGFESDIFEWEFPTNKMINSYTTAQGEIYDLKISNDGNVLAASDIGGKVKYWKLNEGGASYSYVSDPSGGTFFDISNDGKLIASGGTNDAIHIFDIGAQQEIENFPTGHEFVESIAFSKNNSEVVVSGYNKKVLAWDISTGESIKDFQTDAAIIQVDDHTNKRFFLTGDDYDVVVCSAVSDDGKKLVYGSRDQMAYLWNYEEGYLIDILEGHQNVVTSVGFSSDNTKVITASYDGSFKIWDAASGDLIATFIALEGDTQDFVIYSPDGYFMASKNGTSTVHFTQGKQVFLFDQFDLKFNRPDIMLKRVGYATEELINTYEKAFQKRLAKMGFTEEMLSDEFNAPIVRIDNQLPKSTSDRLVKLSVSASDELFDIRSINIYANGVPILGQEGENLLTHHKNQFIREYTLKLSAGSNVIEAVAYNEKGVKSMNDRVTIELKAEIEKPDLYLIAIGVSEYNQDEYDLNYAAKDANDIAMLMKSSGAYSTVHEVVLTNEEVTRERIMEVRQALEKTQVDDQVIVFIASHGLLDKDLDYYIATSDIDFSNPSDRGMSYASLEELLDGIPSRKKLMMIDACHSGEVDKESDGLAFNPVASTPANGEITFRGFESQASTISLQNSFELMKRLFVDLRKGTGTIVLSSASGSEYAFESSEYKNGIFTYALINAIRSSSADLNKDEKISISELSRYIFEKVAELTGGKQTPTFRRENLEFDYTIW